MQSFRFLACIQVDENKALVRHGNAALPASIVGIGLGETVCIGCRLPISLQGTCQISTIKFYVTEDQQRPVSTPVIATLSGESQDNVIGALRFGAKSYRAIA